MPRYHLRHLQVWNDKEFHTIALQFPTDPGIDPISSPSEAHAGRSALPYSGSKPENLV